MENIEEKFVVTIPSRARPDGLLKFFGRHYDPKFHWAVGLDSCDMDLYKPVRQAYYTNVRYVYGENDRGIPHTRNNLAEYAYDVGADFVFMCDDNVKFKTEQLEDFVRAMISKPDIIWLGAMQGHYRRFYAAEVKNRKDDFIQVPLAGSAYLFRLSFWEEERYDEVLHHIEDAEMWLRIRKIFYPDIPIYNYVPFEVSKPRYQEGGNTKWRGREEILMADVAHVNKKYGLDVIRFCKDKKLTVRTGWKKFQDYLASQHEVPDGTTK